MKKILLKISGEFLMSGQQAIAMSACTRVAKEIKSLIDKKVKVAVVVGAGNIMRGGKVKGDFDKVKLHYAGMSGVLANQLALQASLEQLKVRSVVDSTLNPIRIGHAHHPDRAKFEFNQGTVLVMGGTGLPYVTTDTAAVIFSLELNVDVLLKATKVNGVYDKDPKKYRGAKKFDQLSYREVLDKGLKVMDLSAFALAAEQKLPIRVFKWQTGALAKLVKGEKLGTLVS